MKRFSHRLIALVLILGLAITACAAPGAATPAAAKPAAANPTAAPPQLTREQQLIEGAKKEGEVALWVTSIEERESLIRLFEARYPFLKLKIWESNTAGMMARVAEEAKVGRHSGDILMMGGRGFADLYADGLLAEYEYPNVVGWPQQPTHNFYKFPYSTGRLVVYNTDLVSPADVPRSWDDVKSTRWAGKAIVSISGTDIPLLWAYLWMENGKLNWDRSLAFWGDVFRNTRPLTGSGYSGPVARVAAGEVPLMIAVASPSAMVMMARGAPIAVAPLGTYPGVDSGIAMVKGAAHPNAGKLLIDWLTTPEGLLAYANPRMALVLHPQLQGKARANRFLVSLGLTVKLIPVDLQTDENLRRASDFWAKSTGLRG